MEKDTIARSLIIQYLEYCSKNDVGTNFEEIEVAIDCLKNIWKIDQPNITLPGIKSILDLIPDPKYDTEKAMKLKVEGNSSLTSGDYETAINKYTEAIKLDPTQSTFYCNRAAAYSKREEHEKAIIDAEKAIALDSKYANAYSRLGFAFWSLNKIEEARDAYKKGLIACPGNKSLTESLEALGPEPSDSNNNNNNPNINETLEGLAGMFAGNPLLSQFSEKLKNPQVQKLLQEPDMLELIQQIQQNPNSIMSKMNDPIMMKLIGAIMQ